MKPTVFIGSSTEGLNVAYTIQEALQYSAEPTAWTQGIFDLSKSTLTSLLEALNEYEFAVFVLTLDDVTKLRDKEVRTPRDNVIFELGLFMGVLGQDKTYFVVPRDSADLHLPSDLLGIEPATYDAARRDGNLTAALGPACHRISQSISEQYRFTYGDENVDIFHGLEERLKRILLKIVSDAEIPTGFPLPESVEDESVSSLWQICETLSITIKDDMTMLHYQTLGLSIKERGELASPIEILAVKQYLSELEERIGNWESRAAF